MAGHFGPSHTFDQMHGSNIWRSLGTACMPYAPTARSREIRTLTKVDYSPPNTDSLATRSGSRCRILTR